MQKFEDNIDCDYFCSVCIRGGTFSITPLLYREIFSLYTPIKINATQFSCEHHLGTKLADQMKKQLNFCYALSSRFHFWG